MTRVSGAACCAVLLLCLSLGAGGRGEAAASPAEQFAPTNLTAEQVFARSRHARGRMPPGTYREVSRTTRSDGSQIVEAFEWDGDDYVDRENESGFVSADGSYRGKSWTQDANGLVLSTADYEAHANPFVVAMSNASASSGVTVLGIAPGPPRAIVVELTPAKGLVERRYYDATTFLLQRLERRDYSGHTRTWTYGDYRSESGWQVAHSIVESSDLNDKTSKTVLESLARVAPGSVDFAIPKSKPLFDLAGRDAVAIPATFSMNGIMVRVSIGGRGLDFWLDTGAAGLLIDPGVASELGMPISDRSLESFGGDFEVANTRAPDFAVGDLRATNVAMYAAALDDWQVTSRVVGLLGGEFVGSGVLDVDFEKKTVTLRSAVPPDLAAKGWSVVPIVVDDDVPTFEAAFSGRPGHFIADTGAFYSMLFPHYFDEFHIEVPKGTKDQGEMETIAGQGFGIKHYTMNRLTLGDWIFGDVQVTVPSEAKAQQADFDGLIGYDILSNFDLMFDYANRQLWFKPLGTAPPAK